MTLQQLLFLTSEKHLIKNVAVSKNISAGGLCFRSFHPYETGTYLLMYLDENALEDLKINRGQVMKAGNYFMGRIIWNRPSMNAEDPFYEVGFAFLERTEGDSDALELFTRLVNHFTAEHLADS